MLVLLPLFTSQRADRVRDLDARTKLDAVEEIVLALALFGITAVVFVGALPIVSDAWHHAGRSVAGAPPLMVVVAWALLAVLGVWQLSLVIRAAAMLPRLPRWR